MMKLMQRTQRLFLQVAAPVFLVAGVAMFFALEWSLKHFEEEKMLNEKHEIEVYVRQHDTLPAFFQSIDNRLYGMPLAAGASAEQSFSDTMLLNPLENEMEPFVRLNFPVTMRGKLWQVALFQSSLEREDIAVTVAGLLLALFALMLGVLLWVNRRVSQRVWQPFFQALGRMRRFRLNDAAPLQLPESQVAEFHELNHSLEELAGKAQRDFRNVKQFSENASHELQTPLAVIQNKVDALLQDDTLSEAQLKQLDLIAQNTGRMARLNQTLLLLVKIENDQFAEREQLDLKPLLEKRLRWLEDFFAEKQLTLRCDIAPAILQANPVLAETLVTNLLTNAIKHNVPGGRVDIKLDATRLVVANSAAPPSIAPLQLTERFVKGNTHTEGLGLGLAMVREICEKHGWRLRPAFEQNIWTTEIRFSPL